MSKMPRFCEVCGEEPRDKVHYPLVKLKRHGWICKRCLDNDRRDRKKAAENN